MSDGGRPLGDLGQRQSEAPVAPFVNVYERQSCAFPHSSAYPTLDVPVELARATAQLPVLPYRLPLGRGRYLAPQAPKRHRMRILRRHCRYLLAMGIPERLGLVK